MAIAILTGDTYDFRHILKSAWQWDDGRKAWTREVKDGDTPEWLLDRYVRKLNGIRNRGKFTVIIEDDPR